MPPRQTSPVRGFRLVKLVNHHLEVPGGLYTTSFWVTMATKSWNKLSGAHKAALMKAGGAAGAKLIGRGWDDADGKAKRLVIDAGDHTISTIASAELKRWSDKLDIIRATWIRRADAKGHDGKKLLAELMTMMKAPTN